MSKYKQFQNNRVKRTPQKIAIKTKQRLIERRKQYQQELQMPGGQLITIKLVVIGDPYVGKTSILQSYIREEFREDYHPTVFDNHSVIVKSGKNAINLGLWDTAGQEEYGSLRPLAYSNCDIFLIVFSVVEKASFQNSYLKWYKQLDKVAHNTVKIFVGNKTDLRNPNNPQHITFQKASRQLTEKLHVPYYECSALTRNGLEAVFKNSIEVCLQDRKKKLKRDREKCCRVF